MTSREFAEWMEYYKLDPFGTERDDLRVAYLTALTANVYRDRDATEPFSPADFIWSPPDADAPAVAQRSGESQPWQQQLTIVEMLTAMYGGTDTRQHRQKG
jgi:hypothetical protein